MFEGVIEQFRPTLHRIDQFGAAVLARLTSIEQTIKDGAAEAEFGDRIHRIPGNLPGAGSASLGLVPQNQLWVVDYIWADVAGWTINLGGVPRYGPGPTLTQAQPLVMLPGEEWSIVVTAATNYGIQVTRQFLDQKPRAAHSGNGAPEGMTTPGSPGPLHEIGRDVIDRAPYPPLPVPVLRALPTVDRR